MANFSNRKPIYLSEEYPDSFLSEEESIEKWEREHPGMNWEDEVEAAHFRRLERIAIANEY